ncbi:hypothetical protein CJ030_MR7G017420 [Morella rubra]|uniref:Uncharacterized protein n=1 Tax=Morella rubra TaxID=262757 RepID=A0A6A1V6H1_9ROSI|nr:hypothetical protein CJ030_MR7G017420 [Morella rubra]
MIPLTRNEVETYVPVTDKSDQQQREVEGTMILRNHSVKIVVILKNMTPRTKDDVMPAGGKRLRDVGIRHVRGSTRGIALLKARTGGKLTVHIPDGRTGGDDKASSMLSSHIGALVRQHVPFDTSKWKEVPEGVKSYVMNRVLRRSAINKENRAKLKIVHTSGARSFQRARALLKNSESDEISAALLYKKTHTNKDGMWTSEDARENFVSCNIRFNDAFVCVYVSYVLVFILFSNFVGKNGSVTVAVRVRGKVIHEVEIFAEVLGTKAGYVRGLGRSVRSVGSSSSVSSVDLSRKLEEARLQIEEMRARQLEYEALLVKRSDMEQTMREHLQMMEEQQWKKDEELMQMMAEQQ